MHIRTFSFLALLCGAAPLTLTGCGGNDASKHDMDEGEGEDEDMGGGGGGDDGGGGGGEDMAPDPLRFGTFVKVRFNTPGDIPTTTVTLPQDIDTGTSSLCDANNDQAAQYCVVAGTDITLAANQTLRAHGSKPLVLLATGKVNLDGTIDVSSKHSGTNPVGAGAATTSLCTGTIAATNFSGGFGGSFQGEGGVGGQDNGHGAPGNTIDSPTELRGGCPGGGGSPSQSDGRSKGGSGGGAVAIIAHEIHLNGKINASGAAGTGGPQAKVGAGGGGSGGLIVLDTPTITTGTSANIWLFANGGGGGQGGGNGAGNDGQESADPLTNGIGGRNTSFNGGSGGSGSAGTSAAALSGLMGSPGSSDAGGGGGGGGAGFIKIVGGASIGNSVTLSPPTTITL